MRFYLDRKINGVWVPVLQQGTRRLKLFKHKGGAQEYAVCRPYAVYKVGEISACRS